MTKCIFFVIYVNVFMRCSWQLSRFPCAAPCLYIQQLKYTQFHLNFTLGCCQASCVPHQLNGRPCLQGDEPTHCFKGFKTMRIILRTIIERKKYPIPWKMRGLLFYLVFKNNTHTHSICEASIAAGPTYHTNSVHPVSFLAFIDSNLRHMKCISCYDSRIFVFKISISVTLLQVPMEDRLSQYFPVSPSY